ncbi:unnamed protein product [Mytilus coruscus]|nr:unnamed protein product [Mytilus coruscus]
MRSSPQACQRTTNAVSYMLWKSNIHTINYVDDFGGVSDNQNAEHDYNFVLELFQRFGLEVSKEKCLPPTKVLTFLGKEYNSIDMTVRIPETKLQETYELLQKFARKKTLHQTSVTTSYWQVGFYFRMCPKRKTFYFTHVTDITKIPFQSLSCSYHR